MFASFSAEILKLRKRPAVWMIVAAWMALEVMFGYRNLGQCAAL
jgi:hypothetical protein